MAATARLRSWAGASSLLGMFARRLSTMGNGVQRCPAVSSGVQQRSSAAPAGAQVRWVVATAIGSGLRGKKALEDRGFTFYTYSTFRHGTSEWEGARFPGNGLPNSWH